MIWHYAWNISSVISLTYKWYDLDEQGKCLFFSCRYEGAPMCNKYDKTSSILQTLFFSQHVDKLHISLLHIRLICRRGAYADCRVSTLLRSKWCLAVSYPTRLDPLTPAWKLIGSFNWFLLKRKVNWGGYWSWKEQCWFVGRRWPTDAEPLWDTSHNLRHKTNTQL